MPEAIGSDLVKAFVGAAHGDLDRLRALAEQEPGLINAAWDWGGGDWETGLGAAAHMGRRDIALYLLDAGARMDVFAAAMLGRLDIVRAMVGDRPALRDARGPHTIPLLQHARAGGEDARGVVAYLEALP